MDAATERAYLSPAMAQYLLNLRTDRPGRLLGQSQIDNLFAAETSSAITGLGWRYGDRNVNDRLLVMVENTLYEAGFDLGVTPSDYFTPSGGTYAPFDIPNPPVFRPLAASGDADDVFNAGVLNPKYRFANFLTETVIVGDPYHYIVYRGPSDTTAAAYDVGYVYLPMPTYGSSWSGTITSSLQAGGSKSNGAVTYKYTYEDWAGRETEPLDTLDVTYGAGNNKADIGVLMPASNSFSAHVNLYVNVTGGTTWYRIHQFDPAGVWGTIQTYNDNLTDALVQAGVALAHLGTNDTPNAASIVAVHKNRVFLNDLSDPSALQMSNTGAIWQFASVPDWNNFPTDGGRFQLDGDAGNAITGLVSFGSFLMIFRNRSIWILQGDDGRDFAVRPLNLDRGCSAPDSIARCDNVIAFWSVDGVYVLSADGGTTKISKDIEPLLLAYEAENWRETVEASQGWYSEKLREYSVQIGAILYVYNFDSGKWRLEGYGEAPFGVDIAHPTVSSTVTYADTFVGAVGTLVSAHPLDTGQAWAEPDYTPSGTGHARLNGAGKADCDEAYVENPMLMDLALSANTQTVEAEFVYHDNDSRFYLIARSNNNASSGSYDAVEAGFRVDGSLHGGSPHWFLQNHKNGELDFQASVSLTQGQSYHLKLTTDDTTAILYVDGVEVLNANYASTFTGASGGYVGYSVGGLVTTAPPTPVSFWRMEEASGTRSDATGAHNLSDGGGVAVGRSTGLYGYAASWDGTSQQFLNCADNTDFSGGAKNMQFGVDVKFSEIPPSFDRCIFSKGRTLATREYKLELLTTDRFRFTAYDSGGTAYTVDSVTFTPSAHLNEWVHIDCGYDNANNAIFIAVNETDGNVTVMGGNPVRDQTDDFRVGIVDSVSGTASVRRLWKGEIDNLVYFSSLLNSGQIRYRYNRGASLEWNGSAWLTHVAGSYETADNWQAIVGSNGNLDPTMTIAAALVVTPQHGTALTLLARTDVNNVAHLDKSTACVTKVCRWKTRPFDGTNEAQRSRRKRLKWIRLFGDGAISDGYIAITADNIRTETYLVSGALAYPQEEILLLQGCTPAMQGRTIDVEFVLNLNGEIRSAQAEYVVLD